MRKGKIIAVIFILLVIFGLGYYRESTTNKKPASSEDKEQLVYPYEACFNLPGGYQETCVFMTTELWGSLNNYSLTEQDKNCRDFEKVDLKSSCYMALGSLLANDGSLSPKEVLKTCEKLSNEDGEFNCRVGASLKLERQKRDGMEVVCEIDENCYKKVKEYLKIWRPVTDR